LPEAFFSQDAFIARKARSAFFGATIAMAIGVATRRLKVRARTASFIVVEVG
jgi:hypothetical protein